MVCATTFPGTIPAIITSASTNISARSNASDRDLSSGSQRLIPGSAFSFSQSCPKSCPFPPLISLFGSHCLCFLALQNSAVNLSMSPAQSPAPALNCNGTVHEYNPLRVQVKRPSTALPTEQRPENALLGTPAAATRLC